MVHAQSSVLDSGLTNLGLKKQHGNIPLRLKCNYTKTKVVQFSKILDIIVVLTFLMHDIFV